MIGRILFVGLILAVAVWGVRLLFRGRTLFRIRVGFDGVKIEGRVPGQANAEVCRFVQSIGLPVGAGFRGVPDGRGFRLTGFRFVPPEMQQRLRNFLYTRAV